MRKSLCLLGLLSMAVAAAGPPAAAQTVTNPTTAEFSPSADHEEVLSDGQPKVSGYDLAFYQAGASEPDQVAALGKPAPDPDGIIRVDLASHLAEWPTPGVTYEARVAAVGPPGSAFSDVSNTFTFVLESCTYFVTADLPDFPASGGTGSITVTVDSGCQWTASSSKTWLTLSTSSGDGSATLTVTAAPNPEPSPRTATITAAGQIFAVTQQAAPCSVALSPASQDFGVDGGTGTVAVSSPAGCSWTVSSEVSWITPATTSGSGSGTVDFTVAASTTPEQRTGALLIAGEMFTVTQAGPHCDTRIRPGSHWFGTEGGTGGFTVDAPAGCDWTVTGAPNWVKVLSGAGGTGSGSVSFQVSRNNRRANRSTNIAVAEEIGTITQAGTRCDLSVTPARVSIDAEGASDSISVTGQGCVWTATSTVEWVVVTDAGPGSGDGLVHYTVARNPSADSRRGSIEIGDQVVEVTQHGASGAASRSLLVGYHTAPGPADITLIEELGGTVNYQYRYIPVLAATVPVNRIADLQATAAVAYVEDDAALSLMRTAQSTGEILDPGVSRIDAPSAWLAGFRGQQVRVGIVDSGIELAHPDLHQAVDGGIDLVGDGRGWGDCHGHGTHVAGVVGARHNLQGTIGVAPEARLYSIRIFDCHGTGATLSKALRGIEWAVDNAMQIVNLSFGWQSATGSRAEEAAMDVAAAQGVVLVAAAGNTTEPATVFPAAYGSVIAVGAVDDRDRLAGFSNYGHSQELTAPGTLALSSVMTGTGVAASLTVDSDNGRPLTAIPVEFSGALSRRSDRTRTVFAGFGTPQEFGEVSCNGRAALVSRGVISLATKAWNAMNANCAALIVYNDRPGDFTGTFGAPGAWLHAVTVSEEAGLYLRDLTEARQTWITLSFEPANQALGSGTSIAAAHVTGVAALVLSKHPGLSVTTVRNILRETADDRGPQGWDPQYGYGRVNAGRAVER